MLRQLGATALNLVEIALQLVVMAEYLLISYQSIQNLQK